MASSSEIHIEGGGYNRPPYVEKPQQEKGTAEDLRNLGASSSNSIDDLRESAKNLGFELEFRDGFYNLGQTRQQEMASRAMEFIYGLNEGQIQVLKKIQQGKFIVEDNYGYVERMLKKEASSTSSFSPEDARMAANKYLDKNAMRKRMAPKESEPIQEGLVIREDLAKKLQELKIRVVKVDNLLNLAIYDKDRGVLRIHNDADSNFVNEYIENTVIGNLHQEENSSVNDGQEVVGGTIEEPSESISNLSDAVEKEPESIEEPQETEDPILNQGAIEPEKENMEELLGSSQLDQVGNLAKDKIIGELKNLREEFAKMDALGHNYSGETGKSFFSLKDEYNAKKEELAELIKSEIRGGGTDQNLSPEQEKEFKSKFDDELYNLLKSENESYKASIKAVRGESILDKAKEGARDLLGTKGMKWYMSLSKTQRFAINTALFTTIVAGVAFLAPTGTAATAIGAGTYRLARGVGSFAGSGLGMWGSNKILKPEQLQEWKIQEEQKIKDSQDSIEVKSEKIKELEEEFDKRLRNLNIKKIGIMALAGGASGVLAGGMLDYAYGGSGGSVADSVGKRTNVNEHLGGGGPKIAPLESVDLPKASQPEVQGGVVKETTSLGESGGVVETPEVVAAKILGDPSAVSQTIPKGGSLWGATRSALEHNNRFQALNAGQKNNIISWYTNKAINNHELLKLDSDPNYGVKLEPNQEVNLSKLFNDQDEFEKAIKRAENLSPKLAEQMERKTAAIENFYKANPGKVLTEEQILNIEEMPQTDLNKEVASIEKPQISSMEEVATIPKHSETSLNQLVAENDVDSASYNTDPDALHTDIEAAKARLAELEQEAPFIKPRVVEVPSREGVAEPTFMRRSMQGDTKSLIEKVNNIETGSALADPVERAFVSEVQAVYGSDGFMGLGKVAGVNSKDWGLIKGLSAKEVVKYYTNDSEQALLPQKVLSELTKSPKHQNFGRQLLGLIADTDGKLIPFDNKESVEVYLKRLGKFVMEKHVEKTASIINSNMKMAA